MTEDHDGRRDGTGRAEPITEDELTAAGARRRADGRAGRGRRPPVLLPRARRPGLLPAWYMPTPMSRVSPRWRLPVVLALVGVFLVIEAFGLCSTFGQVVPA